MMYRSRNRCMRDWRRRRGDAPGLCAPLPVPKRAGPKRTPVASLAARPPSVDYFTLKLCQLVAPDRWVAVLANVTRRRKDPLLAGLYDQL